MEKIKNPSETIAEFINSLEYGNIPGEAKNLAERSIIDTVAVLLAGLGEEPAKLATRLIKLHGSRDSSRLHGKDTAISPMDAALVYGTAAHTLDFDDTSPAINGHPSVTIVPPLIAIADSHEYSGTDLITAYVAGFETQSVIVDPILESHYRLGWHPTATLGVFGSAASAAKLLNLSTTEINHSLNIAASMASGLKSNFGSMTKSLHAGHAARSGLTAALLAQYGFTADSKAISGPGGFQSLYSGGSVNVQGIKETMNDEWALLEHGIHLKKYPCCHFTHSAIEATIDLVNEHDIAPEDIESIGIVGSPGSTATADVS